MYNEVLTILEKNKNDFNLFYKEFKDKYKDNIPTEIKSIIAVQFDGIGDIVSISGCIRELKQNLPDTKLIFCCYENYLSLVKNNPYIDEIITFPKVLGNSLYEQLKVILDKTKDLFNSDLGIHFQYDEKNKLGNLILALTNTKLRIGYSYKDSIKYLYRDENDINDSLLTHIFSPPADIINIVGKYYYLLYKILIFLKDNNYINKVKIQSLKNEIYINKSIKEYDICISLSGSIKSKKYPPEKLVNIINKLDGKVVLIGGKNEIEEANYIEKRCNVINYVGKIELLESVSIIDKSKLYIGNDTGTSHIAACLNIPAVILWKEAKNLTNEYIRRNIVNCLSAYSLFMPWYGIDNTDNLDINEDVFYLLYKKSISNSFLRSISLRPEKAIYPCNTRKGHNGCVISNKHHCISLIKEEDILNAISNMKGNI